MVQQKGFLLFLLHVLAPLTWCVGLHFAARGALEQGVRLLPPLDLIKTSAVFPGAWWVSSDGVFTGPLEGFWHGVLTATSGLADLVWSRWAVPMTSEPGCSAD